MTIAIVTSWGNPAEARCFSRCAVVDSEVLTVRIFKFCYLPVDRLHCWLIRDEDRRDLQTAARAQATRTASLNCHSAPEGQPERSAAGLSL